MRLKLVQEVDFRKSEQMNFEEVMKKEQLVLGPNDVVAFYSRRGNQVAFIWRPTAINFADYGKRPGTATVVRSLRLRLSNRTWDPMMLQNYANDVGLVLEGLRRFEVIVGGKAAA
jgi:hypothetical protein